MARVVRREIRYNKKKYGRKLMRTIWRYTTYLLDYNSDLMRSEICLVQTELVNTDLDCEFLNTYGVFDSLLDIVMPYSITRVAADMEDVIEDYVWDEVHLYISKIYNMVIFVVALLVVSI